MRSTLIGASAGAIIFGVSVSVLAQPPQGKGKPADAGRPSAVQFPAPQNSVGVIHPLQALAPPGNGNGFGLVKVNVATGGNAFGNGNAMGNGSVNGAIGKAPAMTASLASFDAEPLEEARNGMGERYSLQAVLPVAPGGFPSIQKQVPVPECFAR
jgi:hypothetical protein